MVVFQLVPVAFEQALPVKVFRNRRRLVERRPALLIRHFEEKQKRQLLRARPEQRRRIVPVRQPVAAEDVAIVPACLNKLMGLLSIRAPRNCPIDVLESWT
jgi:hypothetical protein